MSEDEIQARIDRVLDQIFDTVEANKRMLDDKLLRLIGLMSVQFNILERDFKYLLICLRDDLPVTDARKTAFKFKNFSELLCEVRKRLSTAA